jgi:hypothetical protein
MNEPSDIHGDHRAEPGQADLAAGHEVSDVNIRGLVVFLTGLVVSLAVVVFAVAWMFRALATRAERNDLKPPPLAELRADQPPGPRLQPSPGIEMDRLRARQERKLSRTEWVDEHEKIARIPIGHAMRRIAEQGLPDWPPVKEGNGKREEKSPADDRASNDAKQALEERR